MKIIPIKTRAFLPSRDNIFPALLDLNLQDGDILCITSKILAIHKGRCVKVGEVEKSELISREADRILSKITHKEKEIYLTIKDNIIIASAGIDESNADGYYVLWPQNVDELLKELHFEICKHKKIRNLGLISTDSATYPLRAGVRGISTGSYGFNPLKNYIGKQDIFGREIKMTKVNISDSIASAAVFCMGEGSESMPIAIVREINEIEFGEFTSASTRIETEDDLFRDFLTIHSNYKD